MVFRYFADPHHFGLYSKEPQTCGLCGEERPVYEGPYYGIEEVEFVCEECLVGGKLAEHDLTTNEGELRTLVEQLTERLPGESPEQITEMARQRKAELEQRTPHLSTWQDFFWPAHCGDYCQYLKVVGKKDLLQLAPDSDGKRFLAKHVEHDVDGLWEHMRADSPYNADLNYSPEFFLFRCLECGEYVLYWDCD